MIFVVGARRCGAYGYFSPKRPRSCAVHRAAARSFRRIGQEAIRGITDANLSFGRLILDELHRSGPKTVNPPWSEYLEPLRRPSG